MPNNKFELSPSVSIIIAGVIIAGAILFANHAGGKAGTDVAAVGGTLPTPTKLNIRPPSNQDHLIGSPTAPIVLVEFSDFQCPYCSMIYPTLKNIVSKSNGQVAWVMRELPLTTIHPQAEPAALASECIAALGGNDAFWKYADAVFADQTRLTTEYSASLAAQLGIDAKTFATCVSSKQYQNLIDTDTNEAMNSGGSGTPFTIIMNTKTGKMVPVEGALPQAQIEKAIASVK